MYDNNGNRTNLTFDAFGESNTYLPNSNQLTNQGSSSITRDTAGNRTSDNNGTRSFTYNQTGRLFQVYEGATLKASYTYNALGQRTRKVTDTSTTVYHYDLTGQLIMESTASGQAQTTYLRTDTNPVAQIDQTNTGDVITYLHTDHLNTPRRGTDVNGLTVWAWQGTAFGSFSANEDPDNDGFNTTINLRFPGQYYDQETKLHYNYFRYYDPSTGRYITSDPIGLRGGLNTFGYVGGNPLYWIDFFGLVSAVRDGTVIRSGWQNPSNPNSGLGWRVTIQFKDGSYDQYGHMDPSTTPKKGTQCEVGDYIGEYATPTNGSSTGPHVHHERRDANGNIIDPGDVSPIPGGSETSPYGSRDPSHPNGHQGRDWVK